MSIAIVRETNKTFKTTTTKVSSSSSSTSTSSTTRRQHIKAQQKLRKIQQNQQLLLFGLTVLIGVIIIAPIGSNAAPLTGGDAHSVEFKRYCSNTLSDAIRLICGGRYYSLGRKFPESVGHGPMRSLQSVTTTDEEDESYYRPLTSGPIHECCRRPCGYSELKLYCASEE